MPDSRRKTRRAYRSPHRSEAAARTRDAIVRAAVDLHARGVVTIAAVAAQAGVAVPTVVRHFPTREDLFGACTRHAAAHTAYPSPGELAAIADPRARVARAVRETYRMHESTFGLCWTGYRLAGESRAMEQALAGYQAVVDALADALLADTTADAPARGFVRAVLGALAYRALRTDGGLSEAQAVASTTQAIARLLNLTT